MLGWIYCHVDEMVMVFHVEGNVVSKHLKAVSRLRKKRVAAAAPNGGAARQASAGNNPQVLSRHVLWHVSVPRHGPWRVGLSCRGPWRDRS
jgi:hypothetical protein